MLRRRSDYTHHDIRVDALFNGVRLTHSGGFPSTRLREFAPVEYMLSAASAVLDIASEHEVLIRDGLPRPSQVTREDLVNRMIVAEGHDTLGCRRDAMVAAVELCRLIHVNGDHFSTLAAIFVEYLDSGAELARKMVARHQAQLAQSRVSAAS